MCQALRRQAQPETHRARAGRSTARQCLPFKAFLWARPQAQPEFRGNWGAHGSPVGDLPSLWEHQAGPTVACRSVWTSVTIGLSSGPAREAKVEQRPGLLRGRHPLWEQVGTEAPWDLLQLYFLHL